ncbi:hypothetical protein BDV95DRAFT_586165 [Massariosphaeria phaeospora]|uniref:Protein efr3 n=1 Tax=Massariosphaeria phaeospora TaxID=100035 RepID=A0A7C8I5G0_9PLEO|nr:hypothetical protein BDV95DRAFT_586165 [Massariosphaeria phaeospora]
MDAARQACRPKHQVLVLKCYPKFQKNNVEVKANSSELSYLLYYASTRRSKLQKVGDFLDKRATTDVWKGRIGNVQVTLQILKALVEKCPRDLPLYAGAALRVLRTILSSDNVAMVEESVPTFETLCAHQDPANLAAEQDYITQYEEIVQLYAQFASKEAKQSKTPISWPVAVRFRKAGLRALKAVASSESLGSETSRQLSAVIPVILLNIFSQTGEYLRRLEARELEEKDHEKEQTTRRRQSISTVRTDDDEGDVIAASGTTEDADRLAEEEVGVIALQALRNIFLGVTRGQLRLATSTVLKFIGGHVKPQRDFSVRNHVEDWATTLMVMICGWAPVQDRYAILVGAMEALVRSPIAEYDLERQLVLVTVIEALLSSTINFIGLSVMDVLVGFISHTLLLLQLGGAGTSIHPHPQQTASVASGKIDNNPKSSGNLEGVVVELVKTPSQYRLQLLETVQKCMSSLAVHVYYTDQISDMVGALLSRLKPSQLVASTADAIENPAGAMNAVSSSASLQEKTPYVDRFFSFETARVIALEAVKNIIKTANARRPDGSSASVSRGAVGIRVWEGTQWLLRDPSGQVRKAYVDAVVTWLNLEKKKADLKISDGHRKKEIDKGGLARRAVSNASHREKSPKQSNKSFLPLLHLAVYENALQMVDSEPDYLLLHLLLTTLVNKLGVNAVRSGLPMILRLQEDISTIDNPGAKVRIGSLVHGYLWALSVALDFETSSVGRALHTEISRRNSKGLWIKSIRVPPMLVDQIETPHAEPVRLPTEVVQTEALKPFDDREALVERIADGYSSSLYSPPSSPPGSPGRSASMPVFTSQTANTAPQLPYKIKDELLEDWTRDACLAANSKDSSCASMTGSRTATSYHKKNNYLGVNIPNGQLDSANNSPQPSPRRAHSRPPSAAYGLVGRFTSPNRNSDTSKTAGSSSSLQSAVRVEDLKRVLSGSAPRTSYSVRTATNRHRASSHNSSASESLVSVHSLSDNSFVTADAATTLPPSETPGATLAPRPPTNQDPSSASPPCPSNAAFAHQNAYTDEFVPPVPPIPANHREKSTSPSHSPPNRPKTAPGGNNAGPANGNIAVRKSRSLKRASRGARSVKDTSGSRGRGPAQQSGLGGMQRVSASTRSAGKPDFSGFLDSIDVGENDEEVSDGVGKAPY